MVLKRRAPIVYFLRRALRLCSWLTMPELRKTAGIRNLSEVLKGFCKKLQYNWLTNGKAAQIDERKFRVRTMKRREMHDDCACLQPQTEILHFSTATVRPSERAPELRCLPTIRLRPHVYGQPFTMPGDSILRIALPTDFATSVPGEQDSWPGAPTAILAWPRCIPVVGLGRR